MQLIRRSLTARQRESLATEGRAKIAWGHDPAETVAYLESKGMSLREAKAVVRRALADVGPSWWWELAKAVCGSSLAGLGFIWFESIHERFRAVTRLPTMLAILVTVAGLLLVVTVLVRIVRSVRRYGGLDA